MARPGACYLHSQDCVGPGADKLLSVKPLKTSYNLLCSYSSLTARVTLLTFNTVCWYCLLINSDNLMQSQYVQETSQKERAIENGPSLSINPSIEKPPVDIAQPEGETIDYIGNDEHFLFSLLPSLDETQIKQHSYGN